MSEENFKEIKYFNFISKKNPEILTKKDLENFKQYFSKCFSLGSIGIEDENVKIKLIKELNSEERLKLSYSEFKEIIHNYTKQINLNPKKKLSNTELLDLLKYILIKSEFNYYDLTQ